MRGAVQSCGQTYQPFCSSTGSHGQHGWNSALRGSVCSMDCTAAWSQPRPWRDHHYSVSRAFWFTLFLSDCPSGFPLRASPGKLCLSGWIDRLFDCFLNKIRVKRSVHTKLSKVQAPLYLAWVTSLPMHSSPHLSSSCSVAHKAARFP